jgi:hypothetical protein
MVRSCRLLYQESSLNEAQKRYIREPIFQVAGTGVRHTLDGV